MGSYSKYYSEADFWTKISRFAAAAGRELIHKALLLYFALQNPECPLWARARICAALGYFIWPMDAIPDPTPVWGFADDAGVMSAAVISVTAHIDKGVRKKAARKLLDWFGPL